VDGILEAAKETGANVEEVAKVTVGGAIDAAGSIGSSAVKAVREVLVGTVEGAKKLAGTALPRSRSAADAEPPASGGPEPKVSGAPAGVEKEKAPDVKKRRA